MFEQLDEESEENEETSDRLTTSINTETFGRFHELLEDTLDVFKNAKEQESCWDYMREVHGGCVPEPRIFKLKKMQKYPTREKFTDADLEDPRNIPVPKLIRRLPPCGKRKHPTKKNQYMFHDFLRTMIDKKKIRPFDFMRSWEDLNITPFRNESFYLFDYRSPHFRHRLTAYYGFFRWRSQRVIKKPPRRKNQTLPLLFFMSRNNPEDANTIRFLEPFKFETVDLTKEYLNAKLYRSKHSHIFQQLKTSVIKQKQVHRALTEKAILHVSSNSGSARRGARTFYFNKKRHYYLATLIQMSKSRPEMNMYDPWLEQALKQVPRKLGVRHRQLLKALIEELNVIYKSSTKKITVFSTVIHKKRAKIPFTFVKSDLPANKFNQEIFTKIVDLKRDMLITHRMFRYIKYQAAKIFPNPSFLDLTKLRNDRFYHPKLLVTEITTQIRLFDYYLLTKFYRTLLVYLKSGPNLFDIKLRKIPNFVRLLDQFLNGLVLELINNTVKQCVKDLADPLTTPFLHLYASYDDGKINIDPSIHKIMKYYAGVINQISHIAEDWVHLDYFIIKGRDKRHMNIRFLDKFMQNHQKVVTDNIRILLEPTLYYYDRMALEFAKLSPRLFVVHITNIFSFPKLFRALQEQLKVRKKLRTMSSCIYIGICRIDQTRLISGLSAIVTIHVHDLLTELVLIHIESNFKIQAKFNAVKSRCSRMPQTTEELTALGKYMLQCNTSWMERMKFECVMMLRQAGQLSDFIILTPNHLCLISQTIRVYRTMPASFKQFNILFETTKFEMEDRLQIITDELNYDLEVFGNRYLEGFNNFDMLDKMDYYAQYMIKYVRLMEAFDEKVAFINKEETLFHLALSTYPELDELKTVIYPFAKLILTLYKWMRLRKTWLKGPFGDLVLANIEEALEAYFREITLMHKQYKNKCKQHIVDQYPKRFKGIIDDPDFNMWPSPLKLTYLALDTVKQLKTHLMLIGVMCNPHLSTRHWIEMSKITGYDITPHAGTCLQHFIDYHIEHKLNEFEIISIGAVREATLKENFEKMKAEWNEMFFGTLMYKETGITILASIDDIQSLLDDHIIRTLSMLGSAFVKPIEGEVREWYELLRLVDTALENWGKVQIQWLYLLPIFSSRDISSQMPQEANLYQDVNRSYAGVMKHVMDDPHVLTLAGDNGMNNIFEICLTKLDTINAGVNKYLESKRIIFPRFYFLSNDEMIEILSETRDPKRVQPHLKKLFEGINSLDFNRRYDITAMFSAEGERVKFFKSVSTYDAGGSVEKWLIKLEKQMTKSLKFHIYRSFVNYSIPERDHLVLSWPGQIVLCVTQIFWTSECHACLIRKRPDILKRYHQGLTKQLNNLIELVRGNLSKQKRITLCSLVVLDVHNKDVVLDLFHKKVIGVMDFEWLAQLRYYWYMNVYVKLTNACIPYAYEYLGNTDRLVITPLTDRCYRTLIGAYNLNLNGAPEGPAGTGKTETTKDLAKAIAAQCVVFNCSDGLDYIAMGKFFKGLAASGAWSCFDEFNRIDIEVLSVIAQQILCIVQAIRNKLDRFDFEGTDLKLNPRCFICITMNPGYAGRSELPDNLKVLFRPVAMMVPDYTLIGEISLYSFGFLNARELSIKIVTTYKLCSEQLSSQCHYDYGMRAVKTVLSAAGKLKLKYPLESENKLVLRSIIDVNLPKFLIQDVPLFNGILSDIFPNVVLADPEYANLHTAIKEICKVRNLQPTRIFIHKITQTYEMMLVRHGFMLVGEPFGGKTSILRVLSDALGYMSEKQQDEVPVKYETINPKAVTINQLYGSFDAISHEWSDGVIATAFREFATDRSSNHTWVIFDGPIDAIWIENMNTVLDDNKKLCLNSGEVIQMTPKMSMIFEVMDLSQASPATVSRCGMIYLEPKMVGWKPMALSWAASLPRPWTNDKPDRIMQLCDWLFPAAIKCVRNFKRIADGGSINSVWSTLQIIEMHLREAYTAQFESIKYIVPCMHASFILGIIWGIGGVLDIPSMAQLDQFYKTLWKGENREFPIPRTLDPIDISIPNEGMIIDYYYNFQGKGTWRFYADAIKSVKYDEKANLQNFLVPTVESLRTMKLMELHCKYKVRLMVTGATGTGKTFFIQQLLLNKLSTEDYIPAFITFTTAITANMTQELIMSKLIKKKRGHLGTVPGKTVILFIDDISMPAKEQFGAQPALELLRQYFDHGHWYDLKDTSKIYIENIFLLSAMGLPGGSRQEVYKRFLRHFCLYALNPFTDDSMTKIYLTILTTGFRRGGFPTDTHFLAQQLVAATLTLYRESCEFLLPTPAKCHYVFNVRDFGRVISGHLLVKKESIESKRTFVRLWVHEVLRVFYDRLLDSADRAWFFECIKLRVEKQLKEKFATMLDALSEDPQDKSVTEESLRNLIFTSVMDKDMLEEDRKYEEIPNIEAFCKVAQSALDDYNINHKTGMNIVLFRYALEHLSRICRILSISGGCGLLVGVGGSGRQSLTRLAAFICDQRVTSPEISRSYGLHEWRDDIKKILKEAGGKGKHIVFLLAESQIKHDFILQDVDALLNTGEVPNLFAVDEKQEILEMTRLTAQGGNKNLDVTPLAVFSFFINRCKQDLHIMLCFSPIGTAFRNRLRLFPSIVNCCTIDWYEGWPEDALEKVAKQFLSDVNLEDEVKAAAVSVCKYFHISARVLSERLYATVGKTIYVTSASYLDLIRSYTELISTKQEELMEGKIRYLSGLEKLDFAAEQVKLMQQDLESLQPQLKASVEATQTMLNGVEKEKRVVDVASAQVREDEKMANEQADAAVLLKADCERDLALAIPILEDAISALNTLKPTDITLVKSMKNPPDAVKLVMAAVCVMKDVKPDRIPDHHHPGKKIVDYWGPSKRILGDMGFLQSLKDYDKDDIPPHVIQTIRKTYLPHPDFNPSAVKNASSAAEGLCKWVLAMEKYDVVVKMVAPKKAKLAVAENTLANTKKLLDEKRAELASLEQRLADLNLQLDNALSEKRHLQNEVKICSNKLDKAKNIIGNLGGEKVRWASTAEEMQEKYDCLPGDVLISCGIMAYLAAFDQLFRNSQIDDWISVCVNAGIPTTEDYSLVKNLGTEINIHTWALHGLPADSFSIDNAVIMASSKKWPLFIDPQGQANKWIKALEKNNGLEVIQLTQPAYMKKVEACIEYGKPLLLENIHEDIDAPLDPVLLKSTYKEASFEFISLGEKIVQYNSTFKMYVTTKLRKPHYFPEIFNKLTIINFALTFEGLSDQLLGIVVAKERPDLQEKREHFIVQSANNRVALKETEDDILKVLSTVKGNILEDEAAVNMLDRSKALATDILQKQEAAKDTKIIIDQFRLQYKPVADYSSNLYYTTTELPNVDPMYQYSLNWFINIFIMSIETSGKSKQIEARIEFIEEKFLYDLYVNVCRSLFEKDKSLYSFILCTSLMLFRGELKKKELDFLMTGGLQLKNPIPNGGEGWLSNSAWNELCRLKDLPGFQDIVKQFPQYLNEWKKFYDLPEPNFENVPADYQKLSDFQKLLLFRVFRPDRVVKLIYAFVSNRIGADFISPPQFDLEESYKDSSYKTPLIFILSPGVDPIHSLMVFANKMEYSNKFKVIALGQGQGPRAETLIKISQRNGGWVCLQNCHLCISWMPTLEKLCEELDGDNTNRNFRLWLTSYSTEMFPESILQAGVKMTNEAPTGLQQSLARMYNSEPICLPEFYDSCKGKEEIFTKLLFGLTFFHSLVLERKTFGPIGWNIPYGFNESDYHISVEQLKIYLETYKGVPYKALLYIIGECNYGGRVSDNWDRRTLNTMLSEYINNKIIYTPHHRLCPNADYVFAMPIKYGYSDFMNFIQRLPTTPSPEIYGLHTNSGINRCLNEFKQLMKSMLSVSGTPVNDDEEGVELLMTFVNDILGKMQFEYNPEQATRRYPFDYNESMNTVLVQELERYNILVTTIINSLLLLKSAILGKVAMTAQLETLSHSLFSSQIPVSWSKVSYPSLKPLPSYIDDLTSRIKFLQLWYKRGKPIKYWLSGFFFTQGFLTGVMQNFARQVKESIDKIAFDFKIMPGDVTTSTREGAYVYGMYLDGARWDKERHRLEEQFPKILYAELPILWIKPCLKTALKEKGRYTCPLYKTSERKGVLSTTGHSTNYVLPILLETNKLPKHWIMRGVALLCQLDQ